VNNWIEIIIVAAVVITVFGILWYQGQIKALANYCQETWVELQKCTWPTWDELKGSTVLIMIMIGLLGGLVVVVDFCLTKTFANPLAELCVAGLALVLYQTLRSTANRN
jgi:preprotein translocase subunit SecE